MNNSNLKKPFTAVAYMLVFLAIQAVVQLVVLLAMMAIQQKTFDRLDPLGIIIASVAFSLITITLFIWQRWAPVSRQFIMSRPWSVLLWSLVASLGSIIPSLYYQELLPEWPDSIQRYIDQVAQQMVVVMNTPGGYAVVCLLAPIAEELVFRGAVLRTLLEWQPQHRWLMIALSALLFALAHLNPAQMIHPFLIGLLLGWMYTRTRSIVPGIIYHWANNTAAYLLIRLYQDPDITVTQVFGQPSRALLAVFFSLLIFIPAIYQLNLRMKR